MLGEERVLVYDLPGTTRDSIFIPFERDGVAYTLIDTAGVRRRARVTEAIEKFSIIKTLQAIDAAHVVILMLDARVGIGEQDATLAGYIAEKGRALVLAVNKWDGLEPHERRQIRDQLDRKLPFLGLPVSSSSPPCTAPASATSFRWCAGRMTTRCGNCRPRN